MNTYTRDELTQLIRPDRVHRDIYSDPELFELEMKQIFGRAWLGSAMKARFPSRAISSAPRWRASR